jgi:hypothetical protein
MIERIIQVVLTLFGMARAIYFTAGLFTFMYLGIVALISIWLGC